MSSIRTRRLAAGVLALCLSAVSAVAGTVTQTNIVSDGVVKAITIDKTLINPWGVSFGATSPFWLSDNGTGISPIYAADGSFKFSVTVPPPAGKKVTSAPTGQVFNSTSGFNVTGGKAFFIFATEDGTISGWPGSTAVLAVDNSAKHAVYKGLALVQTKTAAFLFATNFHSGFVEVYDETFKLVKTFRDPRIPLAYAPFNVAVLNGHIYVTYALADAARHDDVPGRGHGYVDEVNAAGGVVKRLIAKGPLNSPWGLAIAPTTFGPLAGSLLVGNFGDGRVNAFGPEVGHFRGALLNASNRPLTIDGLWTITPGNGGGASGGGDTGTLYFTAGPGHEMHGIFGSLTYVPSKTEVAPAE